MASCLLCFEFLRIDSIRGFYLRSIRKKINGLVKEVKKNSKWI